MHISVTRPRWVIELHIYVFVYIQFMYMYISIHVHTSCAGSLFYGRTEAIGQSHKSYNVPVLHHTMHHSEQKCTHFYSEWCIVGDAMSTLWDLWDWSVPRQLMSWLPSSPGHHQPCYGVQNMCWFHWEYQYPLWGQNHKINMNADIFHQYIKQVTTNH